MTDEEKEVAFERINDQWRDDRMTDELSAKRERVLLAALNRAVSEWEQAVAHSDLTAANRKYAEESIRWMRGQFGLTDETGMLMDDGKVI